MTKFMDAFKDMLIQNIPDNACEYYHTALQHQDELQELITLCETNDFHLDYINPEEDRYYSDGKIHIWFFNDEHWGHNEKIEFTYEIHLGWNERSWGYCQCEPTDPFYNTEHKCCGMGCDAIFAEITITKAKSKTFSFNGQSRDLWALQAEWNGTGKNEYENQQKTLRIETLNKQIEELINTRNSLLVE